MARYNENESGRKKRSVLSVVTRIGLLLLFAGIVYIIFFEVTDKVFLRGYVFVCTGFLLFLINASLIGKPVMKMKRLKKICTLPIQGRFVGYDERRKYHRNRKTGKEQVKHRYAPKYEIYLNNRYVRRTLDDYSRRRVEFEGMVDLLANPNGNEIIIVGQGLGYEGRSKVISSVILSILLLVVAAPFLLM